MFEKKKCENCGRGVKEDWDYCPYCGEELIEEESEEMEFKPFSMFEDIDKEFERIDKIFGSEFFGVPKFKAKFPARGGGISITIHSGTGMKPKIEVKTAGEYKKIEPELKRKLGVKAPIEEVEEEIKERKPAKIPKITEEPETKIENLGNKQEIQIKIPGVTSEDDVEIKKLEQSIEVKAFAGDKAYFKLIPVAPNTSVRRKEFKNGVLKIEIER